MPTNLKLLAAQAAGLAALVLLSSHAHAAGGAFVVDDASIDESGVGACKVESWISLASNSDLFAVSTPACVVPLFLPTELSIQATRVRADSESGTSLAPKAKMTLVKPEVGKFGIGIVGASVFNALTGENVASVVYIPVTYPVTDTFKFNMNVGWLYDRPNGLHFANYGVGFEWVPVKDGPVTLIGEVFGAIGERTSPHSLDPRFQVGVRYTPIETLDLDLIYGRNIAGENANWVTVGLNVRFPAEKKK
jgi:hypothetical protein